MLLPVAAVLAGLVFPLALLLHAHSAQGRLGFPLDDPWIHLTYARTLLEGGGFAYFPGDPRTAGSTSPLFTLLAAAGLGMVGDEMVVAHLLGLGAHLGFLLVLAAWARRRLGHPAWAALAVLAAGLDWRVGVLSVSGMETSLFLLAVALVFFGRASRRPFLTSWALGASVWIRPDGMVLAAVLVIAWLIERLWCRQTEEGLAQASGASAAARRPWSWWARALGPCGLLILGYLLFNLAVGGDLLPNTFAAKTTYYAMSSRGAFLQDEVLPLLSGYGWIVLSPFAALAAIAVGVRLASRETPGALAELGWVVGLLLAYVALLPYAHRFARYLVPLVPALAVLAAEGARSAASWLRSRALAGPRRALPAAGAVLLVVAAVRGGAGLREANEQYLLFCDYHHVRHARTGQWLAEHTPEGSVIATHDVGAIAFYSRRRVVDLVGLVTPEVVAHLHTEGYTAYLRQLLDREGVTHVATLQSWLEVDNSSPLFVADPRPEVMMVFPWESGQTHLISPRAVALRRAATASLRRGQRRAALELAEGAARADPGSARAWTVIGMASEANGAQARASEAYRRALTLHPEQELATERLAVLEGARR